MLPLLLVRRYVAPQSSKADRLLGKFGVIQNVLVGDFVEACLPFVGRHAAIEWACLAASTIAGAMIGRGGCRSTAYVPVPVSVGVAGSCTEDGLFWLMAACATSFLLPFAAAFALAGSLKEPSARTA